MTPNQRIVQINAEIERIRTSAALDTATKRAMLKDIGAELNALFTEKRQQVASHRVANSRLDSYERGFERR